MKIAFLPSRPARTAAGLLIGLGLIQGSNASAQTAPAPAKFDPNYPLPLSPDIPHDANLTGVDSLATARRAFDINSWQTFIALNWNVDKAGKPLPKIGDKDGNPYWTTYKDSYNVFLPDGATPAPYEATRSAPPMLAAKGIDNPGVTRLLFKTKKIDKKSQKLEEIDQAFSGALVDVNNNLVHYEILMNKPEFTYLVTNTLYNLDGQVVFSKTNTKLTFPSGDNAVPGEAGLGAIELKLAWKTLDPKKDATERYLTMPAMVADSDGKFVKVTAGLVGMHIAHKTKSSPQWIWSTFEQVDNLAVDELAKGPDGKPLKPSFYDPSQETLPINVQRWEGPYILQENGVLIGPDALPIDSKDYTTLDNGDLVVNNTIVAKPIPTQVQRVIPIEISTQNLTREVQAALRKEKSVLQYYELVGTQWPTDPTAPPTPGGPGTSPGSVANKAGGKPEPVFLTNMTMETYFQHGNQQAGNEEEGNVTDNALIFGTESCIGCHSSAGIATGKDKKGNAIFSGQLTGDFSWLPEMKAQWVKKK